MNSSKIYNDKLFLKINNLSYVVRKITLYTCFLSKNKSLNIKKLRNDIDIIKNLVDDIEKLLK